MAEEADITVNKAEMRMGMQVGIPETLYAHSSPHRMALGCLPAGHADEVHEHQQRHVGTHSLLQQNWHQVGWAVPRLPQQSQSSKVQKGSMEYPVPYRNGAVMDHGSAPLWYHQDSITAWAEGPDGS